MKKQIKASVLIANYNNQKFIDQCIKSLLNQTYQKIEIIFHDDYSKDNSIKEIEKYKSIKIIKNKKKTKFGSFNQLAAYERSFKKSKGDIIFFLDSDDYFKRNKVKEILKIYKLNKNLNAIFDLPILKYDEKNIYVNNKTKLIKNFWPYIPPQSCISIRRKYLNKIFKNIKYKKFPDIWMDFRIAIYLKYITKSFFVLNNNLTYYRQSPNAISSDFKFFSYQWWKRRKQAHEYIVYYFKKNNIFYKKNFDFYLTSLINKFL